MKKKFIKYCNENWSLPYYEVEKALDSIGNHFGLTDAVAGHIRDLADDFECDIDLYDLLDDVCDSTIDYLAQTLLTDKVKMMSYSFGYYGRISFSNEVSTDSEGICWLEKNEFLKYRGCKEEYWNGKTLDEIEWLIDELKAWGDNNVYGFVVEDCIKSKIHKEYTNVDKEDEDYEEEEWEESDSCWGYYGDIDDVNVSMFDQAGLDINDFNEE